MWGFVFVVCLWLHVPVCGGRGGLGALTMYNPEQGDLKHFSYVVNLEQGFLFFSACMQWHLLFGQLYPLCVVEVYAIHLLNTVDGTCVLESSRRFSRSHDVNLVYMNVHAYGVWQPWNSLNYSPYAGGMVNLFLLICFSFFGQSLTVLA